MKRLWIEGVLVVSVLILVAAPALADDALPAVGKAAIEQEVRDALENEQRAMASKGCEGALAFFADREPLFIVNGRTLPTKLAVRAGCGGKVPDPSWRELQHHTVQVLSGTSAYSVSNYRAKSGATQVVTKIWERGSEGWRIVHGHESVANPVRQSP